FRHFRFFTAPMFAALDFVCVQEIEDVPRWHMLGVGFNNIYVTGSIKFDEAETAPARTAEFRALLAQLGVKENAPVLLAGSTFPGEEKIIATVFRELRRDFPELFLIIVPRHVERTDEAIADIIKAGVSFALRTASVARHADCLVVNTTGELRDWYHLSTVVFIGKSLTSIGGQNPVEPVLAGKPVVFGPHMENFRAIVAQWLAQNAAIQVRDFDSLERAMEELLRDEEFRRHLVENARRVLNQ